MAEGLTLLDVLRRCGCADCRQEHEEAIAEIDRLRSKLAPIIIANAEVAKLNAEQAETIERLRAALREAADAIENWGAYASTYFQEKHDLAGDAARFRALAGIETSDAR